MPCFVVKMKQGFFISMKQPPNGVLVFGFRGKKQIITTTDRESRILFVNFFLFLHLI